MSLSKLSISFKCLNSIGNCLDLNNMLSEFIKTFVKESGALSGKFLIFKKSEFEEVVSVGKKIDYLPTSSITETKIHKFDENINSILFKLEKGILIFYYYQENDLQLNISILESLQDRLNLSINSCENVEELRRKNHQLKVKKRKLKKLTNHLKDEITIATKQNLEKEKKIYDQLKMAQMGELIGNIAHQWRQPLNVISTAASGLQLKKELDMLSDYDFQEYTKSIVDSSMYLSNTIEEFRDYIKESHKVKTVVLQERIETALKMVESSFSINNIEIKKGFIEEEKVYFSLILGELLQVLISILNNAKDALVINEIKNKWVKYELKKSEYSIIITIEDNAGGIDKSIIDKIFNPYFTTKHKSQGTGIGLYTAYDIVVNKLNGRLYVKNSKYGAKFYIELPRVMDYVI